MSIIIAVVGMAGSGKSLVSDELVKHGFAFLRFGQITLDTITEKGMPPGEESEKKIREGFRGQYGMGAFAILNIQKIEEMIKEKNVVIDGLYSWSEYKILKDKYKDNKGNKDKFYVIAVHTPPKLRYARVKTRAIENDKAQRFRSFTIEESEARDSAEIENIEKGGPIAMADFHIVNITSKDHIKENVEEILKSIK